MVEIIDIVNFRVFAFKIRPSCSVSGGGEGGAGPTTADVFQHIAKNGVA